MFIYTIIINLIKLYGFKNVKKIILGVKKWIINQNLDLDA